MELAGQGPLIGLEVENDYTALESWTKSFSQIILHTLASSWINVHCHKSVLCSHVPIIFILCAPKLLLICVWFCTAGIASLTAVKISLVYKDLTLNEKEKKREKKKKELSQYYCFKFCALFIQEDLYFQ